MKKLIINGGNELSGTIKIGGAKNSVVALIPAAMLSDEVVIIDNVPNISDVQKLIEMVKLLGAEVTYENDTLIIDNRKSKNAEISEEYSTSIRASYYFMGVLLSKYKKAKISYPGGCVIGSRPIDFHLKGFEKLGAKIKIEDNSYTITAEELKGTEIYLDFASVGATINIMFAAIYAEGTTKIYNAAKEPEIVNIVSLLNSMGARVSGAGTDVITIKGVKKLERGRIEVIPDRIEAGTYIMLGTLLGNNLKIEGVIKEHLGAVIAKLQETGADLKFVENYVIVNKVEKLKSVNIITKTYPGFPTDLGQPMSTLLTQCEGISKFEETIYENRMRHIPHLNEMGANIEADNCNAKIIGKTNLVGREVIATDLRAGAAMMVAGMIAKGTTIITNIEHILRGYENIVDKLSNVGADIKLIED
ncbi:MAG: UDP-N-acetylglucosamine 1-carboxyvinyltransferase [Bacilli bacterium]|nr:UDP-N-acetylglucosamine 1-carboxyvinyltransferase [Bacilli bacterium]